ncbi:MAG: hypothetical protein V3T17_15745 [Pseudomonadales bacterium]
MNEELQVVKIGLFFVMLTLIFGIGMGVIFGVAEGSVKSYISHKVDMHQALHNEYSKNKIWRYAQRSHFHATGIAAFSFGLVFLIMFSSLKRKMKKVASILVGFGGLYPLSWFAMFILAPSIGATAAHHHVVTQGLIYIGVGGLLLGMSILCSNLFLNMFQEV